MSIFNKISKFLNHSENIDIESELTQKVQLMNFTILIVLLFTLIYSLTHIFFFDKINGIVILSFFILLTITFIYFKISLNYKVSFVINLTLLTFLFTYLIFEGVGNNSSIIWGLLYPVILSLLTNYKRSSIFSLSFLFLNIIIFLISNKIDFGADYSTDIIIRYISVYLFIFLFLQFYLRIKQQVFNIKEKKNIEIQQKLSEKNKFLSDLSYQIRTPLNNITGIINLQRNNLEEEVVEEVELSISNLIAIVNSIPELFEKKLIPIKGKKAFFNVNTVIKKSLNLFHTEKYNKLKFSLNLSNKIPGKVFGDRLLLIQIIISVIDFLYNNLSSDSLKLDIISKEKEEDNIIILKIRCSLKENTFNENINISATEIENREIENIKNLTKSASGDLVYKIGENKLSFLFSFNYLEEEKKTKIIDKKEVVAQDNFFSSHKKIKLKDANILLVEDDIMNSKVMTLNLNKVVNKIIIAENGKEALEKYASTKIDLILMDIRMPLMDGFKTTEKIREAEQGTDSQTPIIAVTANASAEIKKRCFKVGMNDYTTKPTNFKLLIIKMKALLE